MAEITLPDDFKEFFELLNSEKVEYLLIGGFAVALHGYSRNTGDIDAWVHATPANAPAIVRVMRKFGFSERTIHEAMFAQPGKTFQMGIEPLRIDVLTKISGVEFADAYPRRETRVISGVPVQVISLEDLKKNKLASGRNKDLADLDYLP